MYVVALAAGVLVGVIYGFLDVRSPTPPVVALIGLLGMLLGEQIVPGAKRLIAGRPITVGWVKSDCVPHIFGELPRKSQTAAVVHREARS
jgi:XapX domain-containing protein